MAVGEAYDDAVRLGKENLDLDIGIHLCLTEERPILTKKDIPSLVGEDSNFLKTHLFFILNYMIGKIDLKDIEKEFDAQIKKVLESGIKPTHIDSHGHIHILPRIFKMVLKLAKKYNIPFVRYPYERLITLKAKLSRRILGLGLNLLCLFSKQKLKNRILVKERHFYGFLDSGHLRIESLRKILETPNSGVAEVVCHPGICEEGITRYRYWGYTWEEELRALICTDIKKIIKEQNIELVSFRDLVD